MTRPYPGGPRHDTQWADLLDAEKRAELRRMADLMRHAYRLATYSPPREATP